MKSKINTSILVGIILLWLLAGCSFVEALQPSPTASPTSLPTSTPVPATVTPTPTETPYFIEAVNFTGDLQVPILIYHRFIPDHAGETNATKMTYSDFKSELQALYDNGFSLISLKSWVEGTFSVPPGRKPIIFTMDDLWFADQLYIDEDGTPSEYSGIGILWRFSQEHPDFGFHIAVFSNMGDKFYADKRVDDWFFIGEGEAWKDKLGTTIAWAIDNGVEVYNHLYQHPQLDKTQNKDILYQIEENDNVTRYFLRRVKREDLIPSLENMIALPFGIWPDNNAGKNIIRDYIDPDGKSVIAIMKAYNLDAKQFTPSYYTEKFDPYEIARITASKYMIDFIVSQKELIPTAQTCQLGPVKQDEINDINVLQRLILEATQTGVCAEGLYQVNSHIFLIRDGVISIQKGVLSSEAKYDPQIPTSTP